MQTIPSCPPTVGMKLASLVIHADEALSPGGHTQDIEVFRINLQDPEVQDYLREMAALALLPVQRA